MTEPAYGLWSLVLINSAHFIFFAFSVFRPRSWRDWRTLGTFTAFVVALFTVQWPTLITLIMFPILLVVYVRLARREETAPVA